jgi:hypothetical protein
MLALQARVLGDKAVREVMSWRQPDGWLAWQFHGTKGTEPGIRLLCEKGVERTHPVLAGAARRLVALSPIPRIIVRYGSRVYVPGSFAMHDFRPDMAAMDSPQWSQWFQRMELLARLGVVGAIPQLQQQVGILRGMLNANGGRLTKELEPRAFRSWGAYALGSLEEDWRRPERRMYDLTFRSLLILHYAERGAC